MKGQLVSLWMRPMPNPFQKIDKALYLWAGPSIWTIGGLSRSGVEREYRLSGTAHGPAKSLQIRPKIGANLDPYFRADDHMVAQLFNHHFWVSPYICIQGGCDCWTNDAYWWATCLARISVFVSRSPTLVLLCLIIHDDVTLPLKGAYQSFGNLCITTSIFLIVTNNLYF